MNIEQQPDLRPGNYYVSVIDGERRALLAGPWPTHQRALDHVPRVRAKAYEIDARSHWYAFGTARTEPEDVRCGSLNSALKFCTCPAGLDSDLCTNCWPQ
jgi:hypothetical protein